MLFAERLRPAVATRHDGPGDAAGWKDRPAQQPALVPASPVPPV